MPAVTDYLFDTSYLKEVLTYLETVHAIDVRVVDSDGNCLPIGNHAVPPAGVSRFLPFPFARDIGGLLCYATSEARLDQAAPHISICLSGIDQQLQREDELKQAGNELLELSEQLHFLYNLAGKIIGISSMHDLCTMILQEISKAIEADYALVRTPALLREKVEINCDLTSGRAAELEQLGFLHEKTWEQTVIYSLPDGTFALTSPIRGKEGTIGYMAFFRNRGNRAFSAYHKKFVSIIENIYSPTIETFRLYDSLQELYLNTVKALAAAIDAKDPYTHGHSFRVARFSVAIARKMEIEEKRLKDLEIAAYMHDLGKIGIPESILGKPDKLTPAEFCEIKKHPVLTDKILQPVNLPEIITDAAIHHHERLDGSGYPKGLQGEQISTFARIIAVADVFDALTSDRPYRKSIPVEESLRTLCEGIDAKFDRQVVLALASALEEDQIDSVLADQNIKFSFLEIHQLNDFLREIIEVLLHTDPKNRQQWPGRSIN
jgi:HD-GYP domain-containing protein (c-di-GMP phosphodiesterase class II)